jgi:hypothetical protein
VLDPVGNVLVLCIGYWFRRTQNYNHEPQQQQQQKQQQQK